MESIIKDLISKIESAGSMHDLLHVIKPAIMGEGSEIDSLNKKIRTADPEQKKEIGKRLSLIRSTAESAINARIKEFQDADLLAKLSEEKIDGTLPSRSRHLGSVHPITKVAKEIIDIFSIYGFVLNSGPEIEDDWHNFSALNIPDHHPARQMHDTFYLNSGQDGNDGKFLLRTHTTAVDIRAISKNGAPIKSMSFGKTFRCDSDRTHSPMFHQFELVQIDKNISMQDLNGYIMMFLRAFFQKDDIQIRLRPSFFPFTEPSAEVDIGYCIRDGKIIVGEEVTGFMEILGCGILHPNVLQNCGIAEEEYTGIAFGMGVERMGMLKYGINDLRMFFESDISWLKNNSFSFADL